MNWRATDGAVETVETARIASRKPEMPVFKAAEEEASCLASSHGEYISIVFLPAPSLESEYEGWVELQRQSVRKLRFPF